MNESLIAKIALLLILFCSHTANVWGQNKLDEVVVFNLEAEKELKSVADQLESINDSIHQFTVELAADSALLKRFRIQHDSLLHLNSEAFLSDLRQTEDSLEKLNDSLLLQIKDKVSTLEARRKELDKNQDAMLRMRAFSVVQKQNRFDEHMQYVRGRFSQMDSVMLHSLSAGAAEYAGMEKYEVYVKALRYAIFCRTIYNDGLKAINSPFNQDSIVAVRLRIYDCLQVKNDDLNKGVFSLPKEQFVELDTLDIKLSRYRTGMRELKNILAEINADKQIKKLRTQSTNDANKEQLCNLILLYVSPDRHTSPERFKKHERYFEMIPYLNKLLKTYWEEIKVNPFKFPTETEQLIVHTKTEE